MTDLQSVHRANIVLTKSTLKGNLDEGDFRWRYCAQSDHIEAAVDALMDSVKTKDPVVTAAKKQNRLILLYRSSEVQ